MSRIVDIQPVVDKLELIKDKGILAGVILADIYNLPPATAKPDESKYEYKYSHTDCIWNSGEGSTCPSTCAQYRDGWNDAMEYIFKGGKGYNPYERGKQR